MTGAPRASTRPDRRGLTQRYRVLTNALVRATTQPVVRSRLVPAAAALPWVFSACVNTLAY